MTWAPTRGPGVRQHRVALARRRPGGEPGRERRPRRCRGATGRSSPRSGPGSDRPSGRRTRPGTCRRSSRPTGRAIARCRPRRVDAVTTNCGRRRTAACTIAGRPDARRERDAAVARRRRPATTAVTWPPRLGDRRRRDRRRRRGRRTVVAGAVDVGPVGAGSRSSWAASGRGRRDRLGRARRTAGSGARGRDEHDRGATARIRLLRSAR